MSIRKLGPKKPSPLPQNVSRKSSPATVQPDMAQITAYFPSAEEQIQATSTSVNDAAAGTGLRTITIVGYDDAGTKISEDLTIGGAGSIDNFRCIVWPECVGATYGSTGDNEGIITISGTGPGSNMGSGAVRQFGALHTCCFQIPAGYSGYVVGLSGSNAYLTGISLDCYYQPSGGVWTLMPGSPSWIGADVEANIKPIELAAGTNVMARAFDNATSVFGCTMEILMIPV